MQKERNRVHGALDQVRREAEPLSPVGVLLPSRRPARNKTASHGQLNLRLWSDGHSSSRTASGRCAVRLLGDLCRSGDCAILESEFLRHANASGIREPQRTLAAAIRDGEMYRESIDGQVLLFPAELRDAELTIVRCARHLAEGGQKKFQLIDSGNHGATTDFLIAFLSSSKERIGFLAPDNDGAKWWAMKIGRPTLTSHAWLASDTITRFDSTGFSLNSMTHANHLVLLDASRYGVESLAQILEAIPQSTFVTLIGSLDETPTNGHGQPLRDLFQAGTFNNARLQAGAAHWGHTIRAAIPPTRRSGLAWRLARAS